MEGRWTEDWTPGHLHEHNLTLVQAIARIEELEAENARLTRNLHKFGHHLVILD